MTTERLEMHVLREILRQKLALGRSHRQVAASVGVSAGKVAGVFTDARALGLDAATIDAMSDAELDARLYPKMPPACMRPEPDCAALHLELRRPGVTLALLHVEYLTAHPDGLRYTAFCDRHREWSKRHSPVMRQVHVAGDKLFVDYAGMRPRIVDPQTGEIIEVELFVAVLGASNYTYAEATRTQQVIDFVSSVSRVFSFIGGVTRAVVPDQLKSAVTIACRYDPLIQRTCAELGRHYATAILPARPRSPRDKAKVEVGVQIAERWLLARIRNETFTSLGALNARLFELTADLMGRAARDLPLDVLSRRIDVDGNASRPNCPRSARAPSARPSRCPSAPCATGSPTPRWRAPRPHPRHRRLPPGRRADPASASTCSCRAPRSAPTPPTCPSSASRSSSSACRTSAVAIAASSTRSSSTRGSSSCTGATRCRSCARPRPACATDS
jgi:transposase